MAASTKVCWMSAHVYRKICLPKWRHWWVSFQTQMKQCPCYHCWKFEVNKSFVNMTKNITLKIQIKFCGTSGSQAVMHLRKSPSPILRTWPCWLKKTLRYRWMGPSLRQHHFVYPTECSGLNLNIVWNQQKATSKGEKFKFYWAACPQTPLASVLGTLYLHTIHKYPQCFLVPRLLMRSGMWLI